MRRGEDKVWEGGGGPLLWQLLSYAVVVAGSAYLVPALLLPDTSAGGEAASHQLGKGGGWVEVGGKWNPNIDKCPHQLSLRPGTKALLQWGEESTWCYLVDRPTQLICIWIFICQHTNTKDIAGQSARCYHEHGEVDQHCLLWSIISRCVNGWNKIQDNQQPTKPSLALLSLHGNGRIPCLVQ